MSRPEKPKVYRLRYLPGHVDRLKAVELLAGLLDGIAASDIQIYSLAQSVDPAERPPAKVATLTFSKLPSIIHSDPNGSEWTIDGPGLSKPLILDSRFRGMTPLNDMLPGSHRFE